MIRKKMVVLTGAGISAESGIRNFREMGGLWEEYDVMEVASPEGWARNPELVQRFYNERRKQLLEAKPNGAHIALAEAERHFIVEIITQNVDDLHERAGSTRVLHLHGELRKARSTADPNLVYEIDGWELKMTDTCEKGSPLRPHIVWFGEAVPNMTPAVRLTQGAEIFAVIGTSLNVYPAAGLLEYVPKKCPVFLIDPNDVYVQGRRDVTFIREKASVGVPKMLEMLLG